MSILDEIETGLKPGPVKMNVSGTDGIGKTTFAAGAPDPIFIKTEDGTKYVNTSAFPLCDSFEDVMRRLKQLVEEKHKFKTVVLDTTDWTAKLIQEEVCRQKNVASIEDIGYGKGYTMMEEGFRKILTISRSKLDLTNEIKVYNFLKKKKPKFIFIAAAKVGGIYSNNKYRAEFIYSNLSIQNNIIHAAYKCRIKNLIFLGSSCVYPKLCKQPIKEKYLLNGVLEKTNEPYAIAKIAGIKMCESYNFQYKTN